MNDQPQRAVIYARVSSTKQKTEGSGLGSQVTRCTEYANFRGYQIAEVFTDDMTGRVAARPGMKDMLAFVRKYRRENIVVIIDDISRLARDIDAHRQLRKSIQNAGGVLESPSIEFGEDSDSTLVENLLASVAQHQSQKNSEQVINRMRARLLAGFAVFHPPPGYRWQRQKGGGKVLIIDEPTASVIREGFQAFADGRFTTQSELRRFLEQHPAYATNSGRIKRSYIRTQLENPIYAGYVEHKPWGVSLRKGQHEPLISYETYQKLQARLAACSHAPSKASLGKDFALRGFVTCGDCDTPLYSCWSKGRTKCYPYYLCQTKGCQSYGKSIRRDAIEGDFETLLQSMEPAPVLIDLVRTMMRDIWDQRIASIKSLAVSIRKEIANLEKQIKGLIDRVIDTDSPSLISAYEDRIKSLEADKAKLNEKLNVSEHPKGDFQTATRTALAFLANPWNLWKTGRIEDRRAVLKLTFCGQLPYSRETGFRTIEKEKLSMPFKLLGTSLDPSGKMVGGERLELPAFSV